MSRRGHLAQSIAIALLAGTGASGVLAQETVEEVRVIGSKMNRAVGDLTQPVSIIDELEIQQQGYTNLTEVLRNEASMEFKAVGTPGQFNYPKMRGFGGGHILIVIDGIKINEGSSGGGGNILGQIDPDSIERVEILRGPQATLYGSNSTAGVISITTKSGGTPEFRMKAEAGSLSWRSVGLSARGGTEAGNGRLSYSLNLDDSDTDGVNPLEYTENRTIQGKLGYDGANFAVGGSYWHTDNEFGYAELDEVGGGLGSRAEHWAFQTPDPNSRSATEKDVATFFVSHAINEQWHHRLTLGYDNKIFATEDLDDGLLGTVIAPFDNFTDFSCDYTTQYSAGDQVPVCDSLYLGETRDRNNQADYNLSFSGDRMDLLLGYEHYRQETESTSNSGGYDGEQSINSFYLNGGTDLDAAGRFIASYGIRYDDFDSFGAKTTGSLGVAYDLTDNYNLFANYGTSFRAPSTSQLFSSYGNTALIPEEGDTFEAGIRSQAGRLSGSLTAWHTKLENVISYDGSIPNPRSSFGFGQYINRDQQVTQGIELDLSYALTEQLELRGTYTNTDSESKQDANRFRTVQIADDKVNLGLRYQANAFNVGINAYYSGPRLRWAGDVEMKAYTRVDFNGSYRINESLRLYGRIENLFDEYIEEGLGYKQPGRYGIMGIEYRL